MDLTSGRAINKKNQNKPTFIYWNKSGLLRGMFLANIVGAYKLSSTHPPFSFELKLSLNSSSELFPSIYFCFFFFSEKIQTEKFFEYFLKLDYSKQKIFLHFFIHQKLSKRKFDLEKFFEEIFPNKNYQISIFNEISEAKMKSISLAKEKGFDFCYISSSIIESPLFLKSLVKKNITMVSPLLEDSKSNFNFWVKDFLQNKETISQLFFEDVKSFKGVWTFPIVYNSYLLKSSVFDLILTKFPSSLNLPNNQDYLQDYLFDFKLSCFMLENSFFPQLMISNDTFGKMF